MRHHDLTRHTQSVTDRDRFEAHLAFEAEVFLRDIYPDLRLIREDSALYVVVHHNPCELEKNIDEMPLNDFDRHETVRDTIEETFIDLEHPMGISESHTYFDYNKRREMFSLVCCEPLQPRRPTSDERINHIDDARIRWDEKHA